MAVGKEMFVSSCRNWNRGNLASFKVFIFLVVESVLQAASPPGLLALAD